jgi:hypothetical protein
MLHYKYEIEDYSKNAKNEFSDIEPIANFDTTASKAKDTASQVKQYVPTTPTFCTFSFIVPIDWRSVFDEAYYQFAVAQTGYRIEVLVERNNFENLL